MPRPGRNLAKNGIYHVFNRGISKKSLYFTEGHKVLFYHLIELTAEKYNLRVFAYCLMANHFHFLVQTPDANLDKAMQYFGSRLARGINKEIGADGALFRSRYKSIVVDHDAYLCQVLRYIHLNPVEARIVDRPDQFEDSSYLSYMGQRSNTWLKTSELLSRFSSLRAFDDFHRFGNSKKLKEFYSRQRLYPILNKQTI